MLEDLFEQSLSEGELASERPNRRTLGIWLNAALLALWCAFRIVALVLLNVQLKPHTVLNELIWAARAVGCGVLATGFFLMKRWAWGGVVLYWAVRAGLGYSQFALLFMDVRGVNLGGAFMNTVIPLAFLEYLLSEDCLRVFWIRKRTVLTVATALVTFLSAAAATIILK